MQLSPPALPALILGLTLTSSLSSQAPSYTPFGAGCPGIVGEPVLTAAAGRLPCIGQTFVAEVTNIPFPTAGIGITGLSDTFWGQTPLPFDLTSLDMPGCLLYTDLRRTPTLVIIPGLGTWDTFIPHDSGLLGLDFYQQAFIVDTTVLGLGAIMSNAAHGVIGMPPLPDLVVLAATLTPTTVQAGSTVNMVGVRVRNIGTAVAGGFSVGAYISTDSTIDNNDTLLGERLVGLGPGATVGFSFGDLPIDVTTTAGNYWIGLFADRHDSILELNENNNTLARALTVTQALPELHPLSAPTVIPNPLVPAFPFLPAAFILGAFQVENSGTLPSGPFRIGFYYSTDSSITTSDALMGSIMVGNLAPGAIADIPIHALFTPGGIVPLTNAFIGVLVDDRFMVREVNEGNNDASQAILHL